MADEHEDVAPGVWLNIVRRVRFNGVAPGVAGRIVKAVALDLASYADYETGGRVRPGLARIAVDCEIDYRTARSAFAAIRNLGLLRLVRGARRRGHSDEYQLCLPADLLDRIEVLTPADMDLAIERIRGANRHKEPAPKPGGGPGTGVGDTRTSGPVQASPAPVQPVDNPPVRVPPTPVQPAATEPRTGVAGTPNDASTGVALFQYGCRSAPPPRQSTETSLLTEPDIADLRTAVTASRASPPPEDQISSDVGDEPAPADAPGPCDHGVPPGLRCPACRRGLADTLPPDWGTRDTEAANLAARLRAERDKRLADLYARRPDLRVIPGGAA